MCLPACLPICVSGLLEPGTWGEGGETDRGRQAAAASASARRRLSSTSSTSSASTAHHSGSMRLSVSGGLPGGEREYCCGAGGEGRGQGGRRPPHPSSCCWVARSLTGLVCCASGSGREIRRETMRLSLAGSGPPPSSTRAGPGDEPHMSSGGGGTTNDKKRPGSSQSQRGSLNDKPGEGVSNDRRRRLVEGRQGQAGRQERVDRLEMD